MRLHTTRNTVLLAVAFACALAGVALCQDRPGDAPSVSTFNVEWYPKSPGHGKALFGEIAQLGSPVVGVQEVRDERRFRSEMREFLGPQWEYVHADRCDELCVGLLFDSTRVELLRARTHLDTRVHPGGRPTLEAVLEVDSVAVSAFVVHFKAKPSGISIRERQYEALAEIIDRSRPRSTEFVVVGDFNSVTPRDDRLMGRFAQSTGLYQNSSTVPCSHYWQPDEECITTTLDHVFSSRRSVPARVGGACASVGCDIDGACPVYKRLVSDHCPVTLDLR